jgi:hypothetical protein
LLPLLLLVLLLMLCCSLPLQNTPALLSKQPSIATDGRLSPTQPGTADGSNGALNASNRSSSSQAISHSGSAVNFKGSGVSLANSFGPAGGGSAHSSINSGGQLQQLLQQGSGSAAAAGTADPAALAASARAHASSISGSASGRWQQQKGGVCSGANTGVVVDECMVRWVPYKHANGMAIYYRQTPQEEGRGMPQVRLIPVVVAVAAACEASVLQQQVPPVASVSAGRAAVTRQLHRQWVHPSVAFQLPVAHSGAYLLSILMLRACVDAAGFCGVHAEHSSAGFFLRTHIPTC